MTLSPSVSRETLARLQTHLSLVREWNSRINLVGPSTTEDGFRRHTEDALTLLPYLPSPPATLVDLGSGAGFPGLVLAIASGLDVYLIESDRRKAAFLREAARMTHTPATVLAARAEAVQKLTADVVTARALAPLHLLLELAAPFLHTSSFCLFPKGENYITELEGVRGWSYDVLVHPNPVHPGSVILQLSHVQREV